MKKRTLTELIIIFTCLITAWWAGKNIAPTTSFSEVRLQHQINMETGEAFYLYKDKVTSLKDSVDWTDSPFNPTINQKKNELPKTQTAKKITGDQEEYLLFTSARHFGWFSLLPAFVAILLCFLTREPIVSLLSGAGAGALLIGQYEFPQFIVNNLANSSAAKILILYLWLLGGLMGLWSRTGASRAFAEFMTRKFVTGPRSAKLVAWGLGVVFFQGGTISSVLVGTSVKPVADKEDISHEELAYIVDSTSSPIASQLAFNAWPGYIQAFIFIPGVAFLATETDRIQFFFSSVPFCFYAIFAVLGTFLLSIDKSPFLGKKMKAAIKRAREEKQLDHPDSSPLASITTEVETQGYKANVLEFFLPLLLLLGTAIGTFISSGSPDILLAFSLALSLSALMAIAKGLSIQDTVGAAITGMKSVLSGSVILLIAYVTGQVSKDAGAGFYLVELLGDSLASASLPIILFIISIVIAFSTGSSWGTYAVVFPLAMPLAWAVANNTGMNPDAALFFMTICFAAVMDGSVFGDQCSPVSDTTVLSSMSTGCDLMDHVKTQLPQACFAAIAACICWTLSVIFFC